MRVIAGRLRGRRLRAPRGAATTRPTSDRVREAVFSMLGDVAGASVLDLFAGTGGLGIEALSRGGGRALFVERDRHALQALRGNLDALGLGAPVAEVRAGEALEALRAAPEGGKTYDLVFVDPPYGHAQALAGPLSTLLPAALAPGARVVVESDRRSPLRLALELVRERRYGDTMIAIYSKPDHSEGSLARSEGDPARSADNPAYGQDNPDHGEARA